MYQLSFLDNESQEFLTYLSNGVRSKSVLTTIAIAKALSSLAPMTSAQVEDPESEYKLTVLMDIRSMLSCLNELVVIDSDSILHLTMRFYVLRYYTIFPKMNIVCLSKETAVEDFTGLSAVLDPTAIAAIKENPIELTKIFNGIAKVFEQLKKC